MSNSVQPAATTPLVSSPPPDARAVSWAVVSIMYAVGCLLCVVMGALHLAEVEALRGLWLIFAPFGPCLVYALVQLPRSRQTSKDHAE